MNYPRVRVGGVTVVGECGWATTSGTRPHAAPFDVLRRDLAHLMAGPPTAIDLDFAAAGVFQKLFALHVAPASIPACGRVVVADHRYWWERYHVRRSYNVRRRYGVQRLADPTSIVASPISAELAYQPSTLNEGRPWTAVEVLRDVVQVVQGGLLADLGLSFALNVDDQVVTQLQQINVETLEVDAAGPDAIDAVLKYLPGAELFVDRVGNAVVYSRAFGGENDQLKRVGAELVGRGHVEPVSLARVRPSAIEVWFEREIEVRFDNVEAPGFTSDAGPDGRTMDNVLVVPDFTLNLVGGKPVAQGTYVTFQEALAAWPNAPVLARPLNLRDVQVLLSPYMSLLGALGQAGITRPDADWVARCGAIDAAYRRLYRINRRWMDRISNLYASRVGTINTADGTRGAAAVYSDWARLPGVRALYQQATAGEDLGYATNIAAWPIGGVVTPVTPRADADLTVVDEDQGVLLIEYRLDAARAYRSTLPSQLELDGDDTPPGQLAGDGGPTADALHRTRTITFDSIGDNGQRMPKLTTRHAVAVVLTATPAVAQHRDPSVPSAFHVVRVTPQECPQFAGREDCRGPVMRIRVSRGIETARVAWRDDRAEDIEMAFGLRAGKPNLDDLTLNAVVGGQGGVQEPGGASLQSIANAVASRSYLAMADRRQGQATYVMSGSVEPQGWLRDVQHLVSLRGEQLTLLSLPTSVQQVNLLAFLESSVQRIVLHQVFPGRS